MNRKVSSLVVSILFLFPGLALADTIQGRVAKTGVASLDLTVFDAQGRPYPNGLHLLTDYKTKFTGVASSSNLRVQDAVQTNVSRLKDGRWHADTVQKLQNSQSNLPVSRAPQSNALADALKSPTGQNVTRGAITGAVTGGVASYASGGKGGKGALIGAGVGAAAGLLQGLFSQPAPQQQQPQYSQTNVQYDDNRSS